MLDDFDDFQSATPVVQSAPTLPPTSPVAKANVFELLGGSTPTAKAVTHAKGPSLSGSAFTMGASAPALQPQQTQSSFASFGQAQQSPMRMGMGMAAKSPLSPAGASSTPNYFGSAGPTLNPTQVNQSKPTTPYATKPGTSGGSGAFDDLWSMGLGKPASTTSKPGASGPAKSIKDLEREKQQAAIWGTGGGMGGMQQNRNTSMGNGAGFGGFGGSSSTAPSGGDDLLL